MIGFDPSNRWAEQGDFIGDNKQEVYYSCVFMIFGSRKSIFINSDYKKIILTLDNKSYQRIAEYNKV